MPLTSKNGSEDHSDIQPGHIVRSGSPDLKICVGVLGSPQERSDLLSALKKANAAKEQNISRLYHALVWPVENADVSEKYSVFASSTTEARTLLSQKFGDGYNFSVWGLLESNQPR